MAEHLASIFGTEKDRVNCPFYFKIGCGTQGRGVQRLLHAALHAPPSCPTHTPPPARSRAGHAATATAARACTTGPPSARPSCSRTCTRTRSSTRRWAPTACPCAWTRRPRSRSTRCGAAGVAAAHAPRHAPPAMQLRWQPHGTVARVASMRTAPPRAPAQRAARTPRPHAPMSPRRAPSHRHPVHPCTCTCKTCTCTCKTPPHTSGLLRGRV